MDTAVDKDRALKDDTRLLGRVLGDVLRAQTGEAGFARIEAIRRTAIKTASCPRVGVRIIPVDFRVSLE